MKCTFCNKEITPGTGKIFAYAEGKVVNLCSNKCEKNMMKLGRTPAKLKWTRQKE